MIQFQHRFVQFLLHNNLCHSVPMLSTKPLVVHSHRNLYWIQYYVIQQARQLISYDISNRRRRLNSNSVEPVFFCPPVPLSSPVLLCLPILPVLCIHMQCLPVLLHFTFRLIIQGNPERVSSSINGGGLAGADIA